MKMAYKEVYNRTGQSNSVTKSQERKTIKFTTREGEYVNVADQTYSRPNKSPFYYRYSIPVRLSLGLDDFILYNIGADLFCHSRVKLGQVRFTCMLVVLTCVDTYPKKEKLK